MADGTQITTSNHLSPMEILKPIYRCDDAADRLLAHLKITYGKPTFQDRARVVAGSFLYAANEVLNSAGRKSLGWPHNNNHWTEYPFVGKGMNNEVRNALIAKKLISIVPGTGQTIFNVNGNAATRITSLYEISSSLSKIIDFKSACFSDPHRIPIRVGKVETYPEKKNRKTEKQSSPKLATKQCKNLFKGDWTKVRKRIEAINEFYSKHPLVLPDGFQCSSVTRVFSDSKLTAGGRLYGAYSNHEQVDRVSSTIDDQPVCEIDIRASQPTLLSSLLGFKIGDTWDDLYSNFPLVGKINDHDKRKIARDQVKAVVAELIGVGNAEKTSPSKDLQKEGVDEFLFLRIRDEAKLAIPALAEMKKRGITSNGYLTFHESEIILRTIEELMMNDIPAYSVHDSIIVRQKDQDKAIKVLRDEWSSYCTQNGDQSAKGVSEIYPALSVTYSDMSEKDIQGIWK